MIEPYLPSPRSARRLAALGLAASLLAGAEAALGERRPRDWREFPALTHIRIEPARVVVSSDPDSTNRVWQATYDRREREWSRPALAPPPAADTDSLASVRVFAGSLFDKFPVARLALGDGFTLVHGDTGYALVRDADGAVLGWPVVEADEIGSWSRQVRYGLPRDLPEDEVAELHRAGRLRNVPGPTVTAFGRRWFGLAGGFVSGEGQFGGLVSFDPASGQWRVHRHVLLIDAAVTAIHPLGEDLWMGTARYGPSSLEGASGLVRYRPSAKEWRQYSILNSRISGNLVWAVAGEGNELWVTTNEGVSRYDLERKLWKSWYWERDDDRLELDDDPPSDLADELFR